MRLLTAVSLVRVQQGEFNRSMKPDLIRLHGQAVKTPPFHGGNRGSNPLGVTYSKSLQLCRHGSMAEQLICNQQVAGSSPIASSILWITEKFHMDGFPSGQREQTVNLPSPTSVVRIHPHPHSAGMAELADALDSGSSESNFMQVQVLFPAPNQYNPNQIFQIGNRFGFFLIS